MVAMLVFTLLTNITAWVLFALTDLLAGDYSFVHYIVLAEWLVLPLVASAVYRRVTDGKGGEKRSSGTDKTMYMLIWFIIGTGTAGIVLKAVENERWSGMFSKGDFNRYEFFSFAIAFVFGFMILSAAYELIGFFVEGGFKARRLRKKMGAAAVNG